MRSSSGTKVRGSGPMYCAEGRIILMFSLPRTTKRGRRSCVSTTQVPRRSLRRCGRGFAVLVEGVRYRLLEVHRSSFGSRLPEGLLAELGAHGVRGALVQGAVREVVIVNECSGSFQQAVGRVS